MTLEKLIEEKLNGIKAAPADFHNAILDNQEQVWKQMLSDLKTLKQDYDGRLVFDKRNLAKVDEIMSNLRANLFGGEYMIALNAFIDEIQTSADYTNKILADQLDAKASDFGDDADYKALIAKAQQNTLLLFDSNAVTANVIQPLSEMLTNGIANGVKFMDAVESLRGAMTGPNAYLAKHATTYAKDAFARSDRQYSQLVSRDMGIVFFKYDGPKIATTRYFCCKRIGGYYHRDEIASWGDDEALWNKDDEDKCSNAPGGGRDPDTDSSTIFTLLGGYGCLDVLLPTATQFVPDEWIERAISEGYYSAAV